MSPTIFDASEKQKERKEKELHEELDRLKSESSSQRSSKVIKIEQPPQIEHREEMVEIEDNVTDEVVESEEPEVAETPSRKHRDPSEYSEVIRDLMSSGLGNSSSFNALPNGMAFESQHAHEQILLVLRQHPVVNLAWIAVAILLTFAPFILFPLIPFFALIPAQFGFFGFLGWFLFVAAYVIESFLGWYFNIYIITDERIIDIDFFSLLYKEVSEAKLEKIEDVTATTAGFWGSAFNYGNISIQTAAEKRQFEFAKVPQPAKITKFLNELLLEEEQEKLEGRAM